MGHAAGRSLSLLDPTYASKYIPIIASVSEHQPPSWPSYFTDLQVRCTEIVLKPSLGSFPLAWHSGTLSVAQLLHQRADAHRWWPVEGITLAQTSQ